MTYKIIGDSCCELTAELRHDPRFATVPLTLQVDDAFIRDDETFDQADFLAKVRKSRHTQKSACPSPMEYADACECDADAVFIVTLSKELSGSYNSACLGCRLYREKHPDDPKKLHVFSSDSACSGESLVVMKLVELCQAGLSFDEVVEQTEGYIGTMSTYFVLETLDFLRKNGRLTGIKSFLASTLNIKPVMGSDRGTIIQLDKARGTERALRRMCDIIASDVRKKGLDTRRRVLAIAHCNCPDRAELVRETLTALFPFQQVYLTGTAGVSSLYAGDGGVVVAI